MVDRSRVAQIGAVVMRPPAREQRQLRGRPHPGKAERATRRNEIERPAPKPRRPPRNTEPHRLPERPAPRRATLEVLIALLPRLALGSFPTTFDPTLSPCRFTASPPAQRPTRAP
jgi:hypothetical protein